jgi:hypothetical protein
MAVIKNMTGRAQTYHVEQLLPQKSLTTGEKEKKAIPMSPFRSRLHKPKEIE